jgi:hypothetical protein
MSSYQADQANLAWQVSRTCDGGQCIGVARTGDAVLIGNTSDPTALKFLEVCPISGDSTL